MEAARAADAALVVSTKRYLLLTVVATVIAAAAAYQRVLEMTPAQRRQLVEIAQAEGKRTDAADFRVEGTGETATSDEDSSPLLFSLRVFVAELSSSRLSAVIAVHFLLVTMYHLFLGIGRLCFRQIRSQELQQTKETMIHFVLMRCLLLASTMGPSLDNRTTLAPLFVWLSWLTLLRGLLTLCKARFQHLLTRPMTSIRDLRGLSGVLTLILSLNLLLAFGCSRLNMFTDKISSVPWFEAGLLVIKVMQVGVKVGFHMLDIGNNSLSLSDDDESSSGDGYSENGEFILLLFQTALSAFYLVQLVLYYLYIISVDQFRVSLFDLILIINVKNATVLMLEKIKQVKFYHRLVVDMDKLFPDATREELDAVADDVCVICLKSMPTQAKKLRCGHLFHRFCLRQCLQKASIGDSFTGLDTLTRVANGMALDPPTTGASPTNMNMAALRCPLCRKHVYSGKSNSPSSLDTPGDDSTDVPSPPDTMTDQESGDTPNGDGVARQEPQPHHADEAPVATPAGDTNAAQPPVAEHPGADEVLRFSTEFLSQWIPFPNFSFEIVRHRDGGRIEGGGGNRFEVTPEMVQQIWEVFPQYSLDEIRADLQRTRSPERTMDRILSGRLDQLRQQGGARGGEGEPLGDLADAIDDLEQDLRWSVSALWSSLWGPRRLPHDRAARANADALHAPGFAPPSPRGGAPRRRGSSGEWRQ